jgi:predicted HNH restriction endonuclease
LIDYKGGECEICGYSKCDSALQFHHKDPTEKDFTISGKSLSFDRLKEEVDKCMLVCSNCHAEIHEKTIQPLI